MTQLSLICCQFDIQWEGKESNHKRVRQMLLESQPAVESLIVLPEMFATGFSMNVGKTADEDSYSANFISEIASQFGSYVLAGIVTKDSSDCAFNQAILCDGSGAQIGSYRKMRLFSPAKEDLNYKPGDRVSINTVGGFQMSPFICYDLRFPELFRDAVSQGAELFVVIASWPAQRAEHWCKLLEARAIENQAFVVGVNRCGSDPDNKYAGQTRVIDPWGNVIAEAGSEECVLKCHIDLELLRNYRKQLPFLADMNR